jgi:hypothetical protein
MHRDNSKERKLVKIVYIRVQERGKQELVPLKLYADGSLEPNQ